MVDHYLEWWAFLSHFDITLTPNAKFLIKEMFLFYDGKVLDIK